MKDGNGRASAEKEELLRKIMELENVLEDEASTLFHCIAIEALTEVHIFRAFHALMTMLLEDQRFGAENSRYFLGIRMLLAIVMGRIIEDIARGNFGEPKDESGRRFPRYWEDRHERKAFLVRQNGVLDKPTCVSEDAWASQSPSKESDDSVSE